LRWDRRRQQRSRCAGAAFDIARCSPDARKTRNRYLQKEEAFEATRIDRYRSAVGDEVDGEAVEIGAVVQGVKIRSRGTPRRQPVRTEDAADLLGGLVDIGRGDAAKSGKPCGLRKSLPRTCFRTDGARHL